MTQNIAVKIELGHQASIKRKPSSEGHTHDWLVFVRGAGGTDIEHFVEKVVFHLHNSFQPPKRATKSPPYQVAEQGYGGFMIPIDVYFKTKEEPRKLQFQYDLFLHLEDPPVNHIRQEKLTFRNPTEEFKRKLLKGGGVEVSNSTTSSSSMPAPGSAAVASMDTVSENKPSVPLTNSKPVSVEKIPGKHLKTPTIPQEQNAPQKERGKEQHRSTGSHSSGKPTGEPEPLKKVKKSSHSPAEISAPAPAAVSVSQPKEKKEKAKKTYSDIPLFGRGQGLISERSPPQPPKPYVNHQTVIDAIISKHEVACRNDDQIDEKTKKSSSSSSTTGTGTGTGTGTKGKKHGSGSKRASSEHGGKKEHKKHRKGPSSGGKRRERDAGGTVSIAPSSGDRVNTSTSQHRAPSLVNDTSSDGGSDEFEALVDRARSEKTMSHRSGNIQPRLSSPGPKPGGGALGSLLADMTQNPPCDVLPLSPLPAEPPSIAAAEPHSTAAACQSNAASIDQHTDSDDTLYSSSSETKRKQKKHSAHRKHRGAHKHRSKSRPSSSTAATATDQPDIAKTNSPSPTVSGKTETQPLPVVKPVNVDELYEIHKKLSEMRDRQCIQRVVDLIEPTGHGIVTKRTFDFDLRQLDRPTIRTIQDYLGLTTGEALL